MSEEQQLYILQQAHEQITQQITNHSQAPLNNEQNGVLQGINSANIFTMPTVSQNPTVPDSQPTSNGQTNLTLQQLLNGQISMSGMCILHFFKASQVVNLFSRVLLPPTNLMCISLQD